MKKWVIILLVLAFTVPVSATIYRGAISLQQKSTWLSATGATSGDGLYNKNGVPTWHLGDGGVELSAGLPNQSGQSGKFLLTNGTSPSWATPSSGGGGTELFWDSAEYGANASVANNPGSSITVGIEVTFTAGATASGCKIYWPGSNTTLKASLWSVAGGTRLASGTLAVTGTGIKTISFSAPYNAVAYTPYYFSVWDTAANEFPSSTVVAQFPSPSDPFLGGAHMVYMLRGVYETGDAVPVNAPGPTQFYPVAPIYTVP
jgi:hypothetical protein